MASHSSTQGAGLPVAAVAAFATASAAQHDTKDGASIIEGKDKDSKHRYTNRLISEKSPYLQQHAHNPVDWYPWSQEAFDKARAENKMIFLSVGYSTCHWCHVMEHESFENEDMALLMNQYCVNIKVDREERPDVDKVYMTYIQATQGGGGWPMSVFLTPTLKPLLGGTYFPLDDRYNRPGFRSVVTQLGETWRHKRGALEARSDSIISQIRQQVLAPPKVVGDMATIEAKMMQAGFLQAESGYDGDEGGFGEAPKFPRPVVFNFLFRLYDTWKDHTDDEVKQGAAKALRMCTHTLDAMAAGGIHDHIDGGFHRYSTTHDWHIPHYEKMLYDQAQLASSYIDGFQITKKPLYERVARGILDYVSGPVMCHREGGFFSAEDADSLPPSTRTLGSGMTKKLEGAYYVWEYDEVMKLLGPDNGSLFTWMYGMELKGNTPDGADPHGELTGQNTLIIRHTMDEAAKKFNMTQEQVETILEQCRRTLKKVRDTRPRPHLDDKIITSWNGLMISAFARAAQVFGDDTYLKVAIKAATFIRSTLYNPTTGRLIRNYKDGPSSIDAFADDYAFMIQALIDLYDASYDHHWLQWALDLQTKQDELFWDRSSTNTTTSSSSSSSSGNVSAGYFDSIEGDKSILYRTKEDYDGSEPSPNSVAALNLLRLGQMLSNNGMIEKSKAIIISLSDRLTRAPFAVPQLVCAAHFFLHPVKQIVIALPQSPSSASSPSPPSTATVSTPAVETKSSSSAATAASISDNIWSLPLLRAIHSKYVPNKIIMVMADKESSEWFGSHNSFLSSLTARGSEATAFVCQHYTCKLPTTNPSELIASL